MDMELARAIALAKLDQELCEAIDWIRATIRDCPELLAAFQTYTETSTAVTGTELTPDMLSMLKKFSHIGFGLATLRVTGEVTI
jgi:hypothetical protein